MMIILLRTFVLLSIDAFGWNGLFQRTLTWFFQAVRVLKNQYDPRTDTKKKTLNSCYFVDRPSFPLLMPTIFQRPARSALNLRIQATHATQPTIIIVSLATEILRNFRVWQDQEALCGQPCYYSLSDVFRPKCTRPQETLPLAIRAEQHLCADSQGTHA